MSMLPFDLKQLWRWLYVVPLFFDMRTFAAWFLVWNTLCLTVLNYFCCQVYAIQRWHTLSISSLWRWVTKNRPATKRTKLGGGFKDLFTPAWGRFPCWLIFFRWVEAINPKNMSLFLFDFNTQFLAPIPPPHWGSKDATPCAFGAGHWGVKIWVRLGLNKLDLLVLNPARYLGITGGYVCDQNGMKDFKSYPCGWFWSKCGKNQTKSRKALQTRVRQWSVTHIWFDRKTTFNFISRYWNNIILLFEVASGDPLTRPVQCQRFQSNCQHLLYSAALYSGWFHCMAT